MPYVERNTDGTIKSVFSYNNGGEYIADNHKSMADYIKASDLIRAKTAARERVMKAKLESLCAAEFARIDAAGTIPDVDAI